MNNNENKYIKPPCNGRLFLFFVISIFHLFILFSIYLKLKYISLLFLELSFFIYNYKNPKKLFKILIITFLFFLLNIFFTEGKIIFKIFFLKITEEGIFTGLKRSSILFGTFLITSNIMKNNKKQIIDCLMDKNKSNLIIKSVNYFFVFWDTIGQRYSIKKYFINIIDVYRNKRILIKKESTRINLFRIDFIIYNISIIVFFMVLFFIF